MPEPASKPDLKLVSEDEVETKAAGVALTKVTQEPAAVRQRAIMFLDQMKEAGDTWIRAERQYDAMADVVFAYWQAVLHHPNAWFDEKRRKYIVARLRETRGSLGLLLYAIDGAKRDQRLMGQLKDSDRKYDGISTICRDLEQVERLAESMPAYRRGETHPLLVKYGGGGP